MNLIITYYDPYYNLHGTLNFNYVNEVAKSANAKAICFFDERNELSVKKLKLKRTLTHVEFISLSKFGVEDIYQLMYGDFSSEIKKLCDSVFSKNKPKKILFFNEFYFFKYFEDRLSEKIYFVRSLSKPLLSRLKESSDGSFQFKESIRLEKKRCCAEEEVIGKANMHIVDSRFSQKILKEYYDLESFLIPGIIDIEKFQNIASPDMTLKSAYFLGRTDWQKGLQRLQNPKNFQLEVIGGQILTRGGVPHLDGAQQRGWLAIEDYLPLLKEVPFALFPHIWESNGLTVQEALAMGKIAVVQEGSGGCETYVKHGVTGFVFDFGGEISWESYLEELCANFDLKQISYNAQKSIQENGYEESIKSLAKTIKST